MATSRQTIDVNTARPESIPIDRLPVITDAAVVTALGNDLEGLWQGLMAGRTAIRPIDRFRVDSYDVKLAACIDGLTPAGDRSMLHGLLQRLFEGWAPLPPDAVLITATTKAGIDNLEKYRRRHPADLQDILLSSLPRQVGRRLGLAGGTNISAACASSTIAVARAAAAIAGGRAEAVLVCCIDLVTEFILSGFCALKALSPEPCRPFDLNRRGLSIGEGAAALLLMSRGRAEQERRRPIGSVRGWGVANDATHITAPARNGCGLAQAVATALRRAGIRPDDLDAVNAHGTGTVYNDLMELTAFKQAFGGHVVPTFSIKGAIGHTMGAAGGIEVALGLKALTERQIPPTTGLQEPMTEARGWVATRPVSIVGNHLLTTNSGFGGINAALVLAR